MTKDKYDPGDLKKRLMDFVMGGRFNAEFRRAVREKFGGDTIVGDEHEMISFVDWFALLAFQTHGGTLSRRGEARLPSCVEKAQL